MLRLINLIFNGGFDPKKEILELRSEIDDLKKMIINWEESEIELLSLNQVERSFSSRFANTVKGIIDSIYHEHMIAYGYREFPGSRKKSLIYATTLKHEFFYITKDNNTQIFVDEHFLGNMNDKGLIYGKNNRRLIARINDYDRPVKPIIIGDKGIGAILDPITNDKFNPRAFEYISSKLSHTDFLITTALAIYTIVDRTKEIKKLK
ncbi:hypothetical protein [Portibacter lacus]|uniref:Uncharacterized protein n=1 Tax=Portibacter lacus TaxID=1099794 RepID=A0AA37SL04_9BACT|nr:hypothetical protein [Portibacter lacus]GLR15835.1 hypothetical protein GCM10007940_04500 [Portibacter lacus]